MTAATATLATVDPKRVRAALLKDRQFCAFCPKTVTVTFAVRVNGQTDPLLVAVHDGALTAVSRGGAEQVDFVLAADADVWAKFFAEKQELGCVSR